MAFQTITRRAFALIWALSFLLSTAGEGFGLYPCPYHGAIQHADAPAEPADDDHHHSSSLQQPVSEHSGHSHGNNAGSDPCTHFEVCQNTTGSVLAEHVSSAAVVTYTTPAVVGIVETARFSVRLLPFFLPYPNAPPIVG